MSRCEWSNLVLLKLKGLESIRLDVAKVVEMHFDGVRSPDDELETTKHTSSYPHQWKWTWHADPSVLCVCIVEDSNIFQTKVLKADSQKHPGLAWHDPAFDMLWMLWFNLLISTSSPRSEVWTAWRQTEREQNELQIYFGLHQGCLECTHFRGPFCIFPR